MIQRVIKIIFCFIILFLLSNSVYSSQRFLHIGDKLSNWNNVHSMYQDKSGYVWLTTDYGVNRLSGNNVKSFLYSKTEDGCLPDNYVMSLLQDEDGTIWISTSKWLCKYDENTERFIKVDILNHDAFSNMILHDDFLWLSSRNGIVRFDIKTQEEKFYSVSDLGGVVPNLIYLLNNKIWIAGVNGNIAFLNTDNDNVEVFNITYKHLKGKLLTSVCEDNSGNLLFSIQDGGLLSLNTRTYEQSLFSSEHPSINEKLVNYLFKDSNGVIWVGTDGYGLWQLNEQTKSLVQYHLDNTGFNHYKGKISCIYEDDAKNIWVSYVEKGILIISSDDGGFKTIQNDYFSQANSISDHSIISLCVDKEHNLWIGTNGGGGYVLSQNLQGYTVTDKFLENETVITALYQMDNGKICVGTYLHGFYIFDPKTKEFEQFSTDNCKPVLSNNHIMDFVQDGKGNLWIATNGGGVLCFDTFKKHFVAMYSSSSSDRRKLSSYYCSSLCLDDNFLWIGTVFGLSCIDLNNRHTVPLPSVLSDFKQNIIDIALGDNNFLWLVTRNGLYRYDKSNQTLHEYTTSDGLPDNYVTSLQYIENGGLWVSTNSGLAYYNSYKDSFTSYSRYEGVKISQYKDRVSSQDNTGVLFFGGTQGITYFDNKIFKEATKVKGLVFTDFYISGNKVHVNKKYNDNIILPSSLNYINTIELLSDQNNISVGFDATMFVTPEMVKYEYMLEGFDTKWQKDRMGTRTAVYTNLSPGNYKLKVRAYLSDENDYLERTLNISVAYPLWQTWWAKLLYFIFTVAVIFLSVRFIRLRIREKRHLLEQEHKEALSQSKLQFFTDISHEIRTPLTLVLSPLQQLMRTEKDEKLMHSYNIMHRNTVRILRLINQLLDLRKIEKNQMKLKVQSLNVVSFISDIIESFSPFSKEKNIEISFNYDEIKEDVFVDPDFLDKIIYNLISNAFKYTPKGGSIDVIAKVESDNNLVISVLDTGIGMSKETVNKIFDRFYQANNIGTTGEKGTGIGLHLTKMLVEIHHGSIEVNSEINMGSEFIVKLPCTRESYSSDELLSVVSNEEFKHSGLDTIITFENEAAVNHELINSKKKKTVLIVEDNKDIRDMLVNEYSRSFNILEAENGKEGYDIVLKVFPDVVLTDVMMPVMDGIEMTKKIRQNVAVRHIPVIMLTAKTSIEDKIQGVATGADLYISKPFDLQYLYLSIVNLINKQTLYTAKYTTTEVTESDNDKVKTSDDKMIERLNAIIKERISDPTLNIESLSTEFGISRVHLHRKLKELCQQTPSSYLRNIRLEHAAYLLRTKKISVSEVAYAVGFNSPQYFTNCFKERYGMSPLAYIEKNFNSEE